MENKRRYFRIEVQEMEADISDDIGFCSAQVKDVSRFGICLSEMTRKPSIEGDKFLLIISDQKGHRYKMHVQGRWEEGQGADSILGAEIKNAPWSWTEFISTLEPIKDDAWGPSGKM
ncbi:MAG: hypothetical protein N2A40_03905 [Desulfobulbaceae bacterium]